MNQTTKEMLEVLTGDDVLLHYGTPRHSGRYPWGSGDDPYQHGSRDFLSRVDELKKQGWTETPENIKKEFGLNTTQYRIEKKICKDERRAQLVNQAKSLKEDGLGATEIGRRMGISESSVRSLLNADTEARMNTAKATYDLLKKEVDQKRMIDVGTGVNLELNISNEQLNTALYMLERDGYHIYKGGIPQVTNRGQQTNQKVLAKPDVEHKEIYNYDAVKTVKDYITRDNGSTYEKKFNYPESMSSKRLQINYAEDGGERKDGLVEIRRGVPDLSLGDSHYAQVRILVDGDRYIKGMAVYSDDLPDGVDVRFNTNKKRGTPMRDVLKEIKNDPDNPFGSAIKDADQGGQYWYDSKTGERIPGSSKNPNKKLGLINKRADEGDWDDWKDALPSQFLSKQSTTMAKKQLDIAKADRYAEFDEISNLTNPTIKKHLLQKFADECDGAAVSLQAAALPGQRYQVIIPVNSLRSNEIYAPNFKDGTKLALVRFPHGGTFEIPILTVNNKQPEAKKLLGKDIVDAVAINKTVADRLSGADFDGDTVMCIPTHDRSGRVKISSKPPLKDLEGFDPKASYGPDTYKGRTIKYMKDPKTGKDATQTEMGKISNLITDMTLAGASDQELARAVKHSMVVIDAGKHKLDYKKSEVDNGIEELRKTYQLKYDKNGRLRPGGASTLISRASGQETVTKRQGEAKINIKGKSWYDPSRPEGALIYKTADDLYKLAGSSFDKDTRMFTRTTKDGKKIRYSADDKDAVAKYTPVKVKNDQGVTIGWRSKDGTVDYKVQKRTQKSTKMMEVDNAMDLVSDARHPMELIYADYANSMKSLANRSRKLMMTTGKIEYDKNAKATYQKEVNSLMSKLNDAEKNRVRERAAQRLANVEVESKRASNPDWKPGDVRKASQQAITKYRQEVGSVSRRNRNIIIDDKEWEAIQAGAISETYLKRILNNTDIDSLRERATPKSRMELSPAKQNQIKAMSASYTTAEIAEKLGLSTSTVTKYLKGGN